MKNTLLMLAFSLLSFKATIAQQDLSLLSDDFPIGEEEIKYSFPKIDVTAFENVTPIDPVVALNFKKQFPSVTSPSWYKGNNGSYFASFKTNTAKAMVAYNKKGKWQHTIYDYGEENLQESIREDVKTAYGNYNILKVSEVHIYNDIIYVILLQNSKYIKKLRVYEGDIEEIESFNRAD